MAFPVSNLFLELLPEEIRARLLRRCQAVPMPNAAPLFRAGEASPYMYFPTSGIASIVTELVNGETVEVGLVGREGLLSTNQLLGPMRESHTASMVQVAGTGLRMDFREFEQEFLEVEAVRRLVLRYIQHQSLTLSQLTACNRVHEVEERLARWLLMVSDRIGSEDISITQEFLATMLGTRRSTVTIVAGTLQRGGLISYHRGQVKILDREGLESSACECYGVTRRLFDTMYA